MARQIITQYVPENPPADSVEHLSGYVFRELQRLAAIVNLGVVGFAQIHNTPPERLEEGMVRGADGVNWEPVVGGGKGIYIYLDGSWKKMV